MRFLRKLYSWYGKRTVNTVIGVVLVLIVAGLFFSKDSDTQTSDETEDIKTVEIKTVGELASSEEIDLIGTVESVHEAELVAESGGRVTSVSAKLGDTVRAGQIIAQFENAAERASLLQAEGAYEAALASAEQSESSKESAEVGLRAAEADAVQTINASFITAQSIVRNTLDPLFSSGGFITGFRLNALGRAPQLVDERKAIEGLLSDWSELTDKEDLTRARQIASRIAAFTDSIAEVAANDDNDNKTVGNLDITAIRTNLASARTQLSGILGDMQRAATALENARAELERAEIGGTGPQISAANAQVKQALGTLRAAEAQLESTIVRAPFPGTINTISVKVGQTIAPGAPVARIANNNALEITTFISSDERDRIRTGTPVSIEGAGGSITDIAPTVDPQTGKIEVRIGLSDDTSELKNGDTVRIQFSVSPVSDTAVTLPLQALKLTPDGPVAFTVEDGKLVATAVVLGEVLGERVIIEDGLTSQTQIVTDARGLREGDSVMLAH